MNRLPSDLEFFSEWIESKKASPKGEWRIRCPIHDDHNASASINFEKGVFRCLKVGCVGGTTVAKLKKMVRERGHAGSAEAAMYDPFGGQAPEDRSNGSDAERSVSEALVKGYHERLMGDRPLIDALVERRLIPESLLVKYGIGWESKTKRYTIPIRDENGVVRNVRKYQLDAPADSQKMVNHSVKEWGDVVSFGSPPRLFPLAELAEHEDATVLIAEGELDALVLEGKGLLAVSGTGGANKWMDEWAEHFEDRDVVLLYDNDIGGKAGAKKAQRSLMKAARSVTVCTCLVDEPGGDVTDFFAAGGTLEGLLEHLKEHEPEGDTAPEENPFGEPEMVTTSIIGTMDSSTNGRPLSMHAMVTGRKNPTYSIPRSGEASCNMDAGPKCQHCPMYQDHQGDYTFAIPPTDVEALSNFIDSPRSAYEEHIRRYIKARKCNQLHVTVDEVHTVQELFVSAPMEADDEDFTSRRVYTFGDEFETPTNMVVDMVGTTWPNPRDSRNEFYAWDVQNSQTNIDTFEVTPEFVKRMRQFQPAKGQSPIQKCRDIAAHMCQEVTQIFGRERLHMAMDLTWHSVLSFPFQNGMPIQRGWIEFIVVGDTRTGKSETAIKLSRHYGLGHFISCESVTVAGLIGGVTQVSNQWTLEWGDYTLSDRRLVILDEVSGMSPEVIQAMTSVRSSGEAQVTKIESARTRARVRSVWISNPRQNKYVDEKPTDGIDILRGVIPGNEDLARFDLAMSVREGDVQSSMINRLVHAASPKYSSQDCRDLILWAWSRKPEDIVWGDGVLDYLMEMADRMGQRYAPVPPLIERASVKEKIARLSVAIAVRTFSASKDGQQVLVQKRHVNSALRFMDELYSYVNFGYRRKSERIKRNRRIAEQSVPRVREYLQKHPKVTEFLLDIGGSFRAQDMEEMAHMDRDEVQVVLSFLSGKKMISKDRAQIIMEPTLQELLREF